MSEFRVYGKDGLFHNIVKASAILNGRYAVLPKGTIELNTNNLMASLDLPKDGKYPGVFCIPPYSTVESALPSQNNWETFTFRLLFLCTSNYTGDNKLKRRDANTNTGQHRIEMDWSDMKQLAVEFMYAQESEFSRTRHFYRVAQKDRYRISRVSVMQNDGLSGVVLSFNAQLFMDCVYSDINLDNIVVPVEGTDHDPYHFH